MRRAAWTTVGILMGVVLLGIVGKPEHAAAQEIDVSADIPDTVFRAPTFPPVYQTIFDRDRTRSNWIQTLSYFRNDGRVAFTTSGSMTTQDFVAFPNKSTFGELSGRLDARIAPRWILSLDGRFDMNSSTDGTRNTESRRNRIQIRTQYTLQPVRAMSLSGSVYSEFQQLHDRAAQRIFLRPITEIDPDAVDTLLVQRDSSYTTARRDGLNGFATWNVKPWLELYGTVAGSRIRPTQRSLIRDFANALDGSGGGHAEITRQNTREPSDNSAFTSRLTFTRVPRARLVLGYQGSGLDQSLFDKQLRSQERASIDRNVATARIEYGPRYKIYLTADGSLIRHVADYQLRRSSNSMVTTRQFNTTAALNDTSGRAGVTFGVSRGRNERQVTQNGVTLERYLNGSGYKQISDRFAVDGWASFRLSTSKYLDPRGDQDIARSLLSVGGGYRVTPVCTTTVHFTRNRSHTVSIDPEASSTNAVQTNYQMNATLRLIPSSDFTLRQDYLLSADYRISDFVESQNFLNRIRRIDTDFVDSLFSFAFIRLTHNFVFRDQGTYARREGQDGRTYRATVRTYEQTLAATFGIDIVDGVRLIATESLINQRNFFLLSRTRTNRNRISLHAGLEVNRSLSEGLQILGAVRHIGGYDEKVTPTTPENEEDYWIAGVTVQKEF
jgi:hypothetical protein